MTEPVLDIRQVPTSIHEVNGDRVAKDVDVPTLARQLRLRGAIASAVRASI